jgi:hypothetical protein
MSVLDKDMTTIHRWLRHALQLAAREMTIQKVEISSLRFCLDLRI